MPRPADTSLLADLKRAQEQEGCLHPDLVAVIAEAHGISETQAYGVATFYSLLSTEPRGKFIVRVCRSASCHLGGARDLARSIRETLGIGPGETTPDGLLSLETVSCLGACASAPAAMINDRLYTRLSPDRLRGLLAEVRSGRIPPSDDALPAGSVRAIGRPVLTSPEVDLAGVETDLSPDELLRAVEDSGLRGRGGAAFPAGRKWRLCADAPGDEKYIVCNADEGEPGTFKDRYLMTRHPGLVVSGMALAGRAVGARKGYIYLRGEFVDARESLEREIARGRDASFEIEILTGAGAYICGEETALLESIEGRRPIPRLRPPYPPVSGLFGRPTVINNVETLANVPLIVARGAEWYRGIGTEESAGTKLLSVSGDVARPGIIEAPLGTPLSDVLAEAGAGQLKAALVGGASGRLIPSAEFGRSLSYEDLSPGAGAIIAIGKDRSIRDLVENLMAFFEHESCGECAPCRIGTARAREILSGERETDEPAPRVLQWLGQTLIDASRCGLGQTAPVSLLDALRLFPEEFA